MPYAPAKALEGWNVEVMERWVIKTEKIIYKLLNYEVPLKDTIYSSLTSLKE